MVNIELTVKHSVKIGAGGRQNNSMSRKYRDTRTKENITKLKQKQKEKGNKAIIVVKIKDTRMILLPKQLVELSYL